MFGALPVSSMVTKLDNELGLCIGVPIVLNIHLFMIIKLMLLLLTNGFAGIVVAVFTIVYCSE